MAIPPIRSATTESVHSPSTWERIKKWTKLSLSGTSKIASVGRAIVKLAKCFVAMPRADFGMKASKLPAISLSVLQIPVIVKCVQKLVSPKAALKKIIALSQLIISTSAIAEAISSIAEFLHVVGSIGKRAIQWVPIVNIITYVISFLQLTLSIRSTAKEAHLLRQCKDLLVKMDGATTDKAKAECLQELVGEGSSDKIGLLQELLRKSTKNISIDPVEKQRVEALRNRFEQFKVLAKNILSPDLLGPKTEAEVQAEAEMKNAPLAIHQAHDEVKRMLAQLSTRVRRNIAWKVAEVALSIVGIVGATLLLLTPPGAIVAGCVILVSASVFSFVLWGKKTMFFSKHPFFSEPQQYRIDRALYNIERMLRSLKHTIAARFVGHQRASRATA